jgi:2-polyprenyl-3-methyl-5-hydroxy-6-metoxy-1,4-benzoquinol methylase|tara:strand:+ start:58 stop:657 length:600 start_codon:yes stop_codon:yes gene_type:complete
MTIILKKEWEECYKSGQIPWDNFAQEELIDILNIYNIHPTTLLDIGCGTGSLCIKLGKRGFNTTGIDASPKAIEIANNKSGSFLSKFKVGDIFKKPLNKKFKFVVDTGCFHHNFNNHFVEIVANHLNSKGLWYSAIGSRERRAPFSVSKIPQVPPAFSSQDIADTVSSHFEVILLRTFSRITPSGTKVPFWSCLMRCLK